MAILAARVLELEYHSKHGEWHIPTPSGSLVPALLHTNREARQVGRDIYKWAFGGWWNWEMDILYLRAISDARTWCADGVGCSENDIRSKFAELLYWNTEIKPVQNLAFDSVFWYNYKHRACRRTIDKYGGEGSFVSDGHEDVFYLAEIVAQELGNLRLLWIVPSDPGFNPGTKQWNCGSEVLIRDVGLPVEDSSPFAMPPREGNRVNVRYCKALRDRDPPIDWAGRGAVLEGSFGRWGG
jgi:hypothetical protein